MYSKMSDKGLLELHKQTVNQIARCQNMQLAKKIQLNSAYGALS